MVRRRLIWRIVRLIVISCCVLVVATFATVQVGQRVLRHRAEQLKLDLLHLQVGKSSLSEMQVLMDRWGKYGRYVGSCTAQECDYHVNLSEWLGDSELNIHNSPSPWRFLAVPMVLTAPIVHWQMGSVDAEITLKDGIVTSWRFHVMTQVSKGYAAGWRLLFPAVADFTPYSGYALMAEVRAEPHAPHEFPWPMDNPHPNYAVREPTGCMVCIGIWTELGPDASATEFRDMSNINLNCLTRWSPCTTEGDIFRNAWKQFKSDHEYRQRVEAQNEAMDGCTFPVEQLARNSERIIRVRILSNQVMSDQNPNSTVVSAKMIATLKGPDLIKAGTLVSIFPEWLDRKQNLALTAGSDVFVFEIEPEQNDDKAAKPYLRPEWCAVLPDTPDNAARLSASLGM